MANPSVAPISPQFQNLKIPTYVNPATLNPATQPKLQSPATAPSIAQPEMFPNLTRALGNFGSYLKNAGGFFGTPAAASLGNVALGIGGAVGGPTYKPPVAPSPMIGPQQSNPKTFYNSSVGAVTPTPGSTPAIPSISLHPDITAPSGAVVNPSTGAGSPSAPPSMAAPAISDGGGGAPNPTLIAGSSSSATMPTIPQIDDSGISPIGSSPATPYDNPDYKTAEQAYETAQKLTPEEITNKQNQDALAASEAAALTNTEKQPIPLEFITGQKRVLGEEAANQSDILKNQAATLEAQRTGNVAAAKSALDLATAKASYLAPKVLGYGGSLVNAAGQTLSSSFGGAGGATDTIGKALSDGRLTPDQVTRYGIPFIAQALQNDPGYNFVTQKASVTSDTSSLTQQTQYLDTTQRAYNTATANMGVLQKFMTDNALNQSDVPIVNQLQNKVKSGLTDPGAVAAFQTMLTGLRAEYAQVLSRGGQVTDTARNEANSLIPDNLSPSQMQKLVTQLNKEGTNAINEAQGKVTDIKKRLSSGGSNFGSNQGSSSQGGTIKTSVGEINPNF